MKLRAGSALVTGAGSGIGQAAAALLFAREGEPGRSRRPLARTRPRTPPKTIERAGGEAAGAHERTSAGAPDSESAVHRDARPMGAAGRLLRERRRSPGARPRSRTSTRRTFDRIMAVNVRRACSSGAKHAAPVMKRQRAGVILVHGIDVRRRPRPRRPVLLRLEGRRRRS